MNSVKKTVYIVPENNLWSNLFYHIIKRDCFSDVSALLIGPLTGLRINRIHITEEILENEKSR